MFFYIYKKSLFSVFYTSNIGKNDWATLWKLVDPIILTNATTNFLYYFLSFKIYGKWRNKKAHVLLQYYTHWLFLLIYSHFLYLSDFPWC